MLIEKHKYDQFSDTKVASLFPFHILSYKYARKSVKTKQYIAETQRNITFCQKKSKSEKKIKNNSWMKIWHISLQNALGEIFPCISALWESLIGSCVLEKKIVLKVLETFRKHSRILMKNRKMPYYVYQKIYIKHLLYNTF